MKKYPTKRQKYKFEEDCYDASSLEETYEAEEVVEEDDLEEDDIDEDIQSLTVEISKPDIKITNQDTGPKKRGPKPTKTQFYVEPKEFDECIIQYYKSNIISDDLALMINKIAHKLSYAPNFINYSYRDEMVGDAVVRMMKALIARKYTHNKGSNPFSYFTKIAFNAFRNRIKKEKHSHKALQEYQEEIILGTQTNNHHKNFKAGSEDENFYFTEE